MAGSGHYWAYLRDFGSARWVKYNDSHVGVAADEDQVMADAFGGGSAQTSAYCVLYVDAETGKHKRTTGGGRGVRRRARRDARNTCPRYQTQRFDFFFVCLRAPAATEFATPFVEDAALIPPELQERIATHNAELPEPVAADQQGDGL